MANEASPNLFCPCCGYALDGLLEPRLEGLGVELLREAFVAGAYWGMDNPFGADTDIPQSEALRRWPEGGPR